MRIPVRLLALAPFALLFAGCAEPPPAAAAQQDPTRGIVFSVGRGENGEAVLEPIALLLPEGYNMPMHEESDSVRRAFNARWLAPGRAYDVLSRGERVGTVAVRAPEEPVCTGLLGTGTLNVRLAPPRGWRGLAGAGLPEQTGAPWLRAPTPEEKRELDRMAAALFDAHGIERDELRPNTDTASAALLVHPNARPVLVASYTLDGTQGGYLRRASLFLVAEEGERGYRPAHTWFHDGIEEQVETQRLVDAADLNGDGMPELVVRTNYYESGDYTILRRSELGWLRAYRGGGGGC